MIGVATGTYGDRDYWAVLVERAFRSVQAQTLHCEFQWVHGDTLHEARNEAANKLIKRGCDYLIFLDADDELDYEYAALTSQYAEISSSPFPVVYTATIGIVYGVRDLSPYMQSPKDILKENFITIGALHPAALFKEIGGFDDWPVLEDWAYWAKAFVHGATFVPCPSAVYEVHISSERLGRNKSAPDSVVSDTFTRIRALYGYQAMKAGRQ